MKNVQAIKTEICGHLKYTEFSQFDSATLYKCDTCNLIFTDNIWENTDHKVIYQDYYKYKNEMAGRFSFMIELVVRLFRFFRALKIFTIYPRAKTILDIGSGRGFMLYYLKKYYRYKRTVGTQISKSAFEFSRDKLGLEVYNKDILSLSFGNESFDIVTLWHVLEHIPNPEQYIEHIFKLLNKRGKLVIEVPNFNSWSSPITGKYWLGLDLDYHLYFFTPDSLSALLKKHGFKSKIVHTFSLEYSTFISVQSLVSRITKTDQIFFRCLQAPRFKNFPIGHVFLFILLTPLCFLFNLVLYFSKKGEILLVVAEKNL